MLTLSSPGTSINTPPEIVGLILTSLRPISGRLMRRLAIARASSAVLLLSGAVVIVTAALFGTLIRRGSSLPEEMVEVLVSIFLLCLAGLSSRISAGLFRESCRATLLARLPTTWLHFSAPSVELFEAHFSNFGMVGGGEVSFLLFDPPAVSWESSFFRSFPLCCCPSLGAPAPRVLLVFGSVLLARSSPPCAVPRC